MPRFQHGDCRLQERDSMKRFIPVISVVVFVLFGIQSSPGQVVLVEGSHTLSKLVDSNVTLDPSQAMLNDFAAEIESIGVDPSTGDLYIQLAEQPGVFTPTSVTTHIYKVTPAGSVSPVVLGTGFGINSRGTDLHFDPVTGLLVTQDQNFAGGAASPRWRRERESLGHGRPSCSRAIPTGWTSRPEPGGPTYRRPRSFSLPM